MELLLSYLQMFRVVWIKGRVGFGKTALSVYLAKALLDAQLVDGVISNFPTILPAHIHDDDGTLFNRVVLFDEAWQFVDNRTSISNERGYGAFSRKYGCIFLLPSVQPVDKRLRQITIQPLYRNIFTGVTTWEFVVDDSEKEAAKSRGRFSFDTKLAYGLYSTEYIPINDGGIMRRFNQTFIEMTGSEYGGAGHTANEDRGVEEIPLEIQEHEPAATKK
jgi:hypothetical protein